jgi:hypothetical protein
MGETKALFVGYRLWARRCELQHFCDGVSLAHVVEIAFEPVLPPPVRLGVVALAHLS